MAVRKQVLLLLAAIDVVLLLLGGLVMLRGSEMSARLTVLRDRVAVLSKLVDQRTRFEATFESRLPRPEGKGAREVTAELYDIIDLNVLQATDGLLVRGVDYELKRGTDYDGLAVRIPIESSEFGAVQRFLANVERLQAKHWLAIDELNLELRRTPRRGVAGQATLVLYHRKTQS